MPETLSHRQVMRYNRQIVLPQWDLDGQEKLHNSRILIIGVGGLGCHCAQTLIAAGLGAVTLVDDDTVSLTNLPRQCLFVEDDIDSAKVDAAKQKLHKINPLCQINTIDRRLKDSELFECIQQHNVVLDCTDNQTARLQVNRLCYLAKRPLVSASAIRFEGQLMIVDPTHHSACYECAMGLATDTQDSCSESGVFTPVVAALAAHQSLLTMLCINQQHTKLLNKMHYFDGMTLQWHPFNLAKKPDCPICHSDQD